MRRPSSLLSFYLLFFIACLTAPARAQQVTYHRVESDRVEERLKAATTANRDRQKKLRQLFEEAGCKDFFLKELPVKGSGQPNLVCRLPGKTESEIVVGAHFDHVEAGQGVVDNWSGASLLPTLYESLAADQHQHTFVFIGFTDEEKGLVGSEQYVKDLTGWERSKIRAMVNLDTLGLSPTKVWLSQADKGLAQALNNVAHAMKLPLAAVNVDQVGRSDAEPFARNDVPSLTIHSVTQETFPILHTQRDTIAAVQMNDYYDTYRLVAAYLSYLDQKLPATVEKPVKRIEVTSGDYKK